MSQGSRYCNDLFPRQGMVVIAVVLAASCGCAAPVLLEGPRPVGEPTPAPQGEQWRDLLAPENQGGWDDIAEHEDTFSIEEEVLYIPGRHSSSYVAFMPTLFQDFLLHVEFKLSSGANSGLFFRADPAEPVQRGFEIQLLDDHGQAPNRHGCGALYDVATPMFNMVRPAGQWNSLDLDVRGPFVKVRLNGWKVIDLDVAKMTSPIGKFEIPLAQLPRDGRLMLQDHGHPVWFRNILVCPLPVEP